MTLVVTGHASDKISQLWSHIAHATPSQVLSDPLLSLVTTTLVQLCSLPSDPLQVLVVTLKSFGIYVGPVVDSLEVGQFKVQQVGGGQAKDLGQVGVREGGVFVVFYGEG